MGLLAIKNIDALLNDQTHDQRVLVAKEVALEFRSSGLTEKQRELALSIFYILSEDIKTKVRAALSESLKDCSDIPHALAVKMANDVTEVSLPVLEFSDLLTDDDLLEIIKTKPSQEKTAIARRNVVSAPLSDALVERGDEMVVNTLVRNDGAHVTEGTYAKVLAGYGNVVSINEGLVHRRSLPIAVAEKLVALVSDELRMYLVSTHEVRDSVLETAILQGRENTVANLLEQTDRPVRDVAALVTQMEDRGRLTSSIILKALEVGDLDFFEYGIAARAKIPVRNARVLLGDQGITGFLALYKQACLSMEDYDWAYSRVENLYHAGGGKTVYVGMTQTTFDDGGLGLSDDSWVDVT